MSPGCPFIDRTRELDVLDRAFGRRPLLAIIYGRRRLGKTRLVREFLKRVHGQRVLYYTASLASHQYNLRMLLQEAGRVAGEDLGSITVGSLNSALGLLYRLGFKIVVIDEVTYWVRAAPRVVSELQDFVDNTLPGTDMMLILLGSLVGVMHSHVLGGGAPLYGRALVRLRLGMLSFKDTQHFYPALTADDIVRLYALVGGIPFYNCLLHGVGSLREAVETLIGSPGAPLMEEPLLMLRDELREPAVYNTLLSAIARGYRTPSRISQYAGVPLPHISKYLSVLEALGVVGREVPLFRKKGEYVIVDPPMRTYYTLVEPVRSLVELGEYGKVVEHVLREIDEYTAGTWENLSREYLLKRHVGEGYLVAGRLVHKGEELDIGLVNMDEEKAIVAEVKWSDLSVHEAVKIRRRAVLKAKRLLPGYEVVEAYVFARRIMGSRPDWVVTPEDMLGVD